MLSGGFDSVVDGIASMTPADWFAIALAAMLFFWVLGAYKRLLALRRSVADAWLPLAEAHRHLTFPNERRIAQLAWERLAGEG